MRSNRSDIIADILLFGGLAACIIAPLAYTIARAYGWNPWA